MLARVYRRPEVETLTGLSCATIYRLMAEGRFPKPVKLGERSVAWREADLEVWLAERPAA
jgi:prophage regulatory protein